MFQSTIPAGHGSRKGPRKGLSRGVPVLISASVLAAIVLVNCSTRTGDISKEELASCFTYCLSNDQKGMSIDEVLRAMGRIVGLGHMCKDAELVIKIGEDREPKIVPRDKFSIGYGVDGHKYRARVCEVYVPFTKANSFVGRHKCRCEHAEGI